MNSYTLINNKPVPPSKVLAFLSYGLAYNLITQSTARKLLNSFFDLANREYNER